MSTGISRRRVLAGAVALPWLAACGGGAVKPAVVDKPGVDKPGVDKPAVDKRGVLELEDGTFSSRFWPDHRVHWRLARPDRPGATSKPQRLVVALHGQGGDADSLVIGTHIESHVVPTGLAVATVDGGDFYWHARRSGIDTGRMVTEELLPLLADKGLASDRIGLIGWSMGGYGALLMATRLGPKRVAGVVAASAALWQSPGDAWSGAFDDQEDFARNDVFAARDKLRSIPVRLDCGHDDPFIAANRAFARGLPQATVTFDQGGHNEQYWRPRAGAQMRWLRQRLQ